MSLKEKFIKYYEENETKVDIAFFLGGFVFDVFTLSDIDDPLSIAQQIIYLLITGSILYYEFLVPLGLATVHKKLEKIWKYRELIFHFILGSLLSVYSLFFLKSASLFASAIFVVLLMGLMVANELKVVKKSEVNIKIGLYIICVFSFFSIMIPVLLGFVGLIPFLLALAMTCLFIWCTWSLLLRKSHDRHVLGRKLVLPGVSVVGLFLLFYVVGWIPPVPLSVQNLGVYHKIEKVNGQFVLSYETPDWLFWHTGDQHFVAQPGDAIYIFARLFSPARFNDSVVLHWFFKDPRQGWVTTDRIPMKITGGRIGGYRGYALKQNYAEGEWRVSVETTDQREVGRIYFDVKKTDVLSERNFQQSIF